MLRRSSVYVVLIKNSRRTTLSKAGAPNETGEYWIASTKDGTEYRLGYNPDSENRVKTSDASVPGYVWRWSLDRIKDSNGNCIYFTYFEDKPQLL
ncbi:MAG: hypothetical protein HZA16_08510 [Nitrospirae bacterium]|nr:hypothetical protein [Nitrospirota bacterium]